MKCLNMLVSGTYKNMKTKEELIQLHKELHRSLDQIVACLIENTNWNLTDKSIMELIGWSHQQTIEPVCFKEV